MWAIFTTYMFLASLRTTGAVALVFLLLAAAFILLAIGDMGGGHKSITHAGGYVGITTAIAAWYASFAAVINSTFGKVVMPSSRCGGRDREHDRRSGHKATGSNVSNKIAAHL